MRAIAEWLSAGRYRAALMAVVLAWSPLLTTLSASIVTLIALRRGTGEAVLLSVSGGALLIGLHLLAGGNGIAAAVVILTLWLPTVVFATILRNSRSLTLTIQILVLSAAAAVSLAYLLMHDPPGYWTGTIEMLQPQFEAAGLPRASTQQVAVMASLMTGMLAASLMIMLKLGLLLGYFMATQLIRPGAFGEAFRALRLGRVLAILSVAVFVAAGLPRLGIFDNVAVVLVVAFVFQGIAVCHALARQRKLHVGWLVALYFALLLISPYTALALALLGYIDNWFDIRNRLARA